MTKDFQYTYLQRQNAKAFAYFTTCHTSMNASTPNGASSKD